MKIFLELMYAVFVLRNVNHLAKEIISMKKKVCIGLLAAALIGVLTVQAYGMATMNSDTKQATQTEATTTETTETTQTEQTKAAPAAGEEEVPQTEQGMLSVKGEITEIAQNDHLLSLTVAAEDGQEYIYHLADSTFLYCSDTLAPIGPGKFEVGQKVLVAYNKNTPMTMSLPPQITPQVVVHMGTKKPMNAKVDFFNAEGLSADGQLQLNLSEETAIEDVEGNQINREHIKDKTLLVFYSTETRSIPPQTSPEKVVCVSDVPKEFVEEVKEDKTQDTEKESATEEKPAAQLETHKANGVEYIKLRDAAEAYGYTITWDDAKKCATLTKNDETCTIALNEKAYESKGEKKTFTHAPIIVEDRIYVEQDFAKLIAE